MCAALKDRLQLDSRVGGVRQHEQLVQVRHQAAVCEFNPPAKAADGRWAR